MTAISMIGAGQATCKSVRAPPPQKSLAQVRRGACLQGAQSVVGSPYNVQRSCSAARPPTALRYVSHGALLFTGSCPSR